MWAAPSGGAAKEAHGGAGAGMRPAADAPDLRSLTTRVRCETNPVEQRKATNERGWAELGEVDSALKNVRGGDPSAIERCLTFLEADPRYFRSGYVKESIWRRFMHAPLTDRQRRRLEDVALAYVGRRLTRQYWYMARTMAETGSHAFWREVRRLSEVSERTPARRATMLLAYEQ
jgi:hypothetical protein